MKLIIGLGNPGKEYAGTRHNAGFDAIVLLSRELDAEIGKRVKRRSFVGEGFFRGEKIALVMPQTYMNLSGEAVREHVDFYKLTPADIVVIYDDTALSEGEIRIRKQGSAGGHNGVKNIILHLNTDVFARVRIGIGGKPENWDLKDYVLSKAKPAERELLNQGVENAASAAKMIIGGEIDAAMNKFNTHGSRGLPPSDACL